MTRNWSLEKTPVLVLFNISRLKKIRDDKFAMNVSKKSCLLLENDRFAASTISELFRENQQESWAYKYPLNPQIKIKKWFVAIAKQCYFYLNEIEAADACSNKDIFIESLIGIDSCWHFVMGNIKRGKASPTGTQTA